MARYSWRSELAGVETPQALIGLAQRFLDEWAQEEVRLLPPGAWPAHPQSLDDIVKASLQVQFLAARYLSSEGLFLLKELVLFFTQASIVALRLPDPGSAAAWLAKSDDLG
jgi:hypothetical protein